MIPQFNKLSKEIKIALFLIPGILLIAYMVFFMSNHGAKKDQSDANKIADNADNSSSEEDKFLQRLDITPYEGEAASFRYKPRHRESAVYSIDIWMLSMIEMDLLTAMAQAQANNHGSNAGQNAKDPDLEKKLKELAGKKSRQEIISRGELHLKFYQASNNANKNSSGMQYWDVAANLIDFQYLVNDEKPGNTDALKQPFAFRIKANGIIDNFQFMRGIPPNAQNILKSILYAVQVNLPGEAKNRWLMRETNGTEFYQARYIVTSLDTKNKQAMLFKRKEKYFPSPMLSGLGGSYMSLLGGNKIIKKSQTQIKIPMNGPWFTDYQGEEFESMLTNSGREWANAEATIKARRLDRDAVSIFPDSFADFLRILASSQYFALKYYETDPYLNMLGLGKSLTEALDLYKRLLAQKKDLFADKFLINYMRLYPEMAKNLIDLMDANPKYLSEKQENNMYFLIAKTGHKEAQMALASAFNDSNRKDITRVRGVANSNTVEYPQEELINKLWETHKSADLTTQTGQDMKAMSLYAIGSLGNKEKLNEKVREKTAEQLSNYLASQTDDSLTTTHALDAIGNHGGAQLIPSVKPFLSSGDKGMRINAMRAFRRMEDPKAAEIIRQQYDQEDSTRIKSVAAEVLAEMPTNDQTNEWALERIQEPGSAATHVALGQLLGENLKQYPENAEVLRKVARSGRVSRDVKKMIYRYVTP